MNTRLARGTLLLLSMLALAACSSGGIDTPILGENGCENLGGSSGDPRYLRVYCVTEFDQTAVTAAAGLAEFQAQGFDWSFNADPTTVYSSHSFRSVRAEFAHSVGLSGDGEMIAIIDNGFFLNHPELLDKNITAYGTSTEDDHGTAVAAIAAGSHDDTGIMGIAYNADLHLTSFYTDAQGLADATDHARFSGAIVQNNSWDVSASSINDVLNRNVGVTAYDAFAAELGESLSGATAYVDALANFTQDGVIVFANSNDIDATELNVMAGLPLAFPDLEAGWITALNGNPTFDANGNIVSADRMSASCFEMAQSCLMAEGVVWSALGPDSYSISIGTSFASPIISGGVAVLAEAFPSLSGPEIRDRLLVTADNSFFAFDGSREFQGGLSHGYSDDYGHGFMNLEAALLPIGIIGLPLGSTVAQGITPLSNSIAVTGSAQGDAIIAGLSNSQVMMLDSLGGNFKTSAETLIQSENRADALSAFLEGGNGVSPMSGALKTASVKLNANSPLTFAGGTNAEVRHDLGLAPKPGGLMSAPLDMASIHDDNVAFGARATAGQFDLSAQAFASEFDGSGQTLGASFAVLVGNDSDRFSFGLSYMEEQNAALGLQSPVSGGAMVGVSQAIDLGYSHQFSSDTQFSLSGQVGLTNAAASGYLGSQQDTLFSGYGLNIDQANVFAGGDTLTVSVRQPLTIQSGNMLINLPQTRDVEGNITTLSIPVSLAPSAPQADLGVEYSVPLSPVATLTLGSAYSMNAGNIEGLDAYSLGARYSMQF